MTTSAVARVLAAVGLAMGLVPVVASSASAHAVLLGSDPADQARLASPPAEVLLEFNEPVSVSTGGLRVYDGEGRRLENGAAESVDGTVSIGLSDGMGDGAFVVSWRVVSADGHPLRGAYTFTVGDAVDADPGLVALILSSDRDRVWEVTAAGLRFLAYGGVLLAAGGAFFLTVVHDGAPDRDRLRRVVVTAAGIGWLAMVAGLPVQAALVTGSGPGSLFTDGVAGDVLADGIGWSVLVAGAGLALAVVGLGGRWSPIPALAVAGGVVAAASFALTGHTRVTSPVWLATTADAVHGVAAAGWFGGLVLLAACLWWRRGTDHRTRAELVVRFSTVAAALLAAVAGAGLVLAWSEVRAVRALDTTYGWLLVAKVVVVAAVASVAAWNRWRLLPHLAAAEQDPSRSSPAQTMRRTVTLEAVGLGVAIAVTALLVNVTPARVEAGVGTSYATTVAVGEGTADVLVDPNRVGRNVLHIYLADPDGAPAEVEAVTVEFSLPTADVGPIRREAVDVGSGHWLLETRDLTIAGRWTVELTVRRDQFTEEHGNFDVVINQ